MMAQPNHSKWPSPSMAQPNQWPSPFKTTLRGPAQPADGQMAQPNHIVAQPKDGAHGASERRWRPSPFNGPAQLSRFLMCRQGFYPPPGGTSKGVTGDGDCFKE